LTTEAGIKRAYTRRQSLWNCRTRTRSRRPLCRCAAYGRIPIHLIDRQNLYRFTAAPSRRPWR